jgi:hypothetical protein
MEYLCVDWRGSGLLPAQELIQEKATEGWELVSVVVLPVTYSRIDNDWCRYFFAIDP